MGIGRVVAYGTVVSLGLGALSLRSAYANAKDGSLTMGRDLEQVADLLTNVTGVNLNNQPIFLANATSTDSVGTVLDRFESRCNKNSAFSDTDWRDLANVQGRPIPAQQKAGLNELGVMRKEDPLRHDGVVLCFTRDGKQPTPFLDAMRTFGTTGDIGDLGNMRFVHASQGKSGKTLVQTIWTQGKFNLRDVVSDRPGDAPGSDPALLPRPAHSQRRFTATAVGAPFAARIYRSTDAPEAALKAYDHEMDTRGWGVIDNPYRDQEHELGRWYMKDGYQAMITLRPDGDGTQIVVGEMGTSEQTPSVQTP
jgi:hypothetical protein